MLYRLSVFWYYFRIRLFNLLQYLGWGVAISGILGGVAFTVSTLLSILGHVPNKVVETLFEFTIAALCVSLLILCISVAQLPSALPPDQRPRR